MRFDLRSPNWWWILPLTLLVHVVIADPFEKNHQRRQYTSLNTLENLALPKRDTYGTAAMAQMPRQVKNPGGGPGGSEPGHEGSHNVETRLSLDFLERGQPKMPGGGPGGSTEPPCADGGCLENVPRLFLNSESFEHGQNAGHDQVSTRGENAPRLFLNDNSIDHGENHGHGGGNTNKRGEAEKRAFSEPFHEVSIRSGEVDVQARERPDNDEPKGPESGDRRAVKDTTAPRAEPAILEDRLPTPMAAAARDGKLGETMRIEYLKKRGMGQVSLRREETRLSGIRLLTVFVSFRCQLQDLPDIKRDNDPLYEYYCLLCGCC